MNYFDKLIRRMAGHGLEHTLRSDWFSWDMLMDPFENTAVLPLTYPAVLKRTAAESKSGDTIVESATVFLTPSLNRKIPAKSLSCSLPDKQQEKHNREPGYKASVARPTPQNKEFKSPHSAWNIMPQTLQQNQRASDEAKSTSSLLPRVPGIVKRNTPSRSQQDSYSPLKSDVDNVKHKEPVLVAQEKSPHPASPMVALKRRVSLAEYSETGAARLTPLSAVLDYRPTRKRNKPIHNDRHPRLVIGHMKVDVVPVKEPASPPIKKRTISVDTNRRKQGVNGAQAQKLGFGIGQM